ncbi:HNH endonuclease [Trinickia violacea]|uniref:HNH endonuclease n=1 Tax=Trinickia violacea TaxID=2571746 RepID=A0A4P8J0P3_9BURK|nr:HNH endonuclease signature motif containing protein [Trinickia violacea]QCP54501.1 HNH endonuclease [Trinickia violacea]
MASKRFKGKRCVYCGRDGASETGDHVIARGFYLPSERADLPKVPACTKCNNEKSRLEHHLLTVLPFGARHAAASRTLVELVPPRLEKNPPLHRQLSEAWARQRRGDYAPRWAQNIMLPLDSALMTRLCEYIMIGLAWHHWQADLAPPNQVRAEFFSPAGAASFETLFANPRWGRRLDVTLGAGTVTYRAAQDPNAPSRTIWRFSIYGAILGGVPGQPHVRADAVFGLSNPAPVDPAP